MNEPPLSSKGRNGAKGKETETYVDSEEVSGPPIIAEGFLTKRSISGALGLSWRRRYVTLQRDALSYFVEKCDGRFVKPRGTLLVSKYATVKLYESAENCFQFNSADRTLIAQCESREDLKRWIRALREAIRVQRYVAGHIRRAVHCNGVLKKKSVRGSGYVQTRWFELSGCRLYYYKLSDGMPHELCRVLTVGPNTIIYAKGALLPNDVRRLDFIRLDEDSSSRRHGHEGEVLTLKFRPDLSLSVLFDERKSYSRWTIAFVRSVQYARSLRSSVHEPFVRSCRRFDPAVVRHDDVTSRNRRSMPVSIVDYLKCRPDDIVEMGRLIRPPAPAVLDVQSWIQDVEGRSSFRPSSETSRHSRTRSLKLLNILPQPCRDQRDEKHGREASSPRKDAARLFRSVHDRCLERTREVRAVSTKTFNRVLQSHTLSAAVQAHVAAEAAKLAAHVAFRAMASADVWQHMIDHWTAYAPRCQSHFSWALRRGVPMSKRFKMWRIWTNSDRMKAREPTKFRELYKVPSVPSERSILNDLDRTSESPLFSSPERRGQKIMFHVLKCVALRDAELGYCQGMNWITASLLEVACAYVSSSTTTRTRHETAFGPTRRAVPPKRKSSTALLQGHITRPLPPPPPSRPLPQSPTNTAPQSKRALVHRNAMIVNSLRKSRERRGTSNAGSPSRKSMKTFSILRQGWLWLRREGGFSGLVGASESRYWFILRADALAWYVRKRVSISRVGESYDSLPIDTELSVENADKILDPFQLRIKSKDGRVLTLRAQTRNDCAQWTRSIGSAIIDAQRQYIRRAGLSSSSCHEVASDALVMRSARDSLRQLVLVHGAQNVRYELLRNEMIRSFGHDAYGRIQKRVESRFVELLADAIKIDGMTYVQTKDAQRRSDEIQQTTLTTTSTSSDPLSREDFKMAESVFWMLVSILEKPSFGMRNLFVKGMPKLEFCLAMFEKLLHRTDRVLCDALTAMKEEIQVPIYPTCRLYATQWFMTLFGRDFPLELSLRVWDEFLFDGFDGWLILFKVALALMEKSRHHILNLDFEHTLQYLQHDLPSKIDVSAIMTRAHSIEICPLEFTRLSTEFQSKHGNRQGQ